MTFKDHAYASWKARYGILPPWGKREFVQLAEARKRLPDEATACSTWNTYLEADDAFYEGHPPGIFLACLSKFLVRSMHGRQEELSPQERQNRAERARFERMRNSS